MPPPPWRLQKTSKGASSIFDARGSLILRFERFNPDIAEFIVHCVNSHGPLKEDMWKAIDPNREITTEEVDHIMQTLTNAENF